MGEIQMAVLLIGTLDTKGARSRLRPRLVARSRHRHAGDGRQRHRRTGFIADVPREQVFTAAGSSLAEVRRLADRGKAVTLAAEARDQACRETAPEGKIDGIFGLGGSAGTTIGTVAMRALPYGPAQADGQHARQRPSGSLCWRPRHIDDAFRRRFVWFEPIQPADLVERGGAMMGHGF